MKSTNYDYLERMFFDNWIVPIDKKVKEQKLWHCYTDAYLWSNEVNNFLWL